MKIRNQEEFSASTKNSNLHCTRCVNVNVANHILIDFVYSFPYRKVSNYFQIACVGAACGSSDGGEIGGDNGESSVWIRDGCFTWKRESSSSASKCDSPQTGKAGETGSSSQQEGLEEPTAWMLVDLNLSINPVSVSHLCSVYKEL